GVAHERVEPLGDRMGEGLGVTRLAGAVVARLERDEQPGDAVLVTDSPGVEISAFEDLAAANTAFVAARRLLQFNRGHGLVELHAGMRVYLTSLPRLLSREDRAHFHAVVAAGEGTD
ncbi:MAG: hypothetical protein QOG11_915, partial [Solirubrobacteraceae bacterium]|nr:hypothetical protein [Solirubrobacteraceae bacterium]